MTALQFLSVVITIATFIFTYIYAWKPGFETRHLSMIAACFTIMGLPTLLLLLMTAAMGRWEGVAMFCTLIALYAVGTAAGYLYARMTKNDPFTWGMVCGMAAFMIGGGPAAVMLLP